MAKRKAISPSQTEPTEDTQRVEAEVTAAPGRISLRVTPSELKGCIDAQLHELVNTVRNRNSPPIDGGIAKIGAALDFLARVDPELPDPEPKKETA